MTMDRFVVVVLVLVALTFRLFDVDLSNDCYRYSVGTIE